MRDSSQVESLRPYDAEMSILKKYFATIADTCEYHQMRQIMSIIQSLIERKLINKSNVSSFFQKLSGLNFSSQIKIFKNLQLLAEQGLITVNTFNKIIQDIDKFYPILEFIGDQKDCERLLNDKHKKIKIILLRKFYEQEKLDAEKYRKILDISAGEFPLLVKMLLENTISLGILDGPRNIRKIIKLIQDKVHSNNGDVSFIEPIINLLEELHSSEIMDIYEERKIFNMLLSNINNFNTSERFHEKLLLLFKMFSQLEELNKDTIYTYLSGPLKVVENKIVELIQPSMSPHINIDSDLQRKMLQRFTNIEDFIELQKTWKRVNEFHQMSPENQQKFFSMLVSNSVAAWSDIEKILIILENYQLLTPELEVIVFKTLSLVPDSTVLDLQMALEFLEVSGNLNQENLALLLKAEQPRSMSNELLNLIIPNANSYLDGDKPNMQILRILSGVGNDDSQQIEYFSSFFADLVDRNIITTNNKLGQAIFDAFIEQDTAGINQDSVSKNIFMLEVVIDKLYRLNLLGRESVANDYNLRKLLTKTDEVVALYGVLEYLETIELINTNNAQIIFDNIIKLPSIHDFVHIQNLLYEYYIDLQPKMLNLLFKIPSNQQEDLIKMWGLFREDIGEYLEYDNDINSIDSINDSTKKLFEMFSSTEKKLLLDVCRNLINIDIPVDFNMFSILVGTPQEHLEKLNKQLLEPDMCLSQAETFEPCATLQFLAIYTKAVHQKLQDLYKKESPDLIANDEESSMKDAQLKRANERFLQLSRKYDPILREYGGIEKVEQKIREKLLEAILREQDGESNDISNFFEHHSILELAACAADPDDPLTKEMRTLFISNKYPSPQIAWRAYDRGAATVEWPNLLTPSSSDEKIFSTTESRAGMTDEFNMGTATIHARTYAALAFLASQDKELNDIQQNDIWQDFVCYIGEIRRAHNETNQGTDNPSCFPGTISRISQIINKHHNFPQLDNEEVVTIKNNVRAFVNICLKKSLQELSNESDREKLFFGLMLMHDLDDTILNPDSILKILPDIEDSGALTIDEKQKIIQQYMQARVSFFIKLSDGIVEYISNKLRDRNISISQAQINYLIGECLVNISSSLSISQKDIYQSTEEVKIDSSNSEEVSIATDDLPRPNEGARDAPNELFAIIDYWIPKLKIEIDEKLSDIISNKILRIAIINELFRSFMNDLRKQPSKKVLIDNLRKKNIDEVFDNLLKELYIPEKDLRDMQQNTRSKIQSALSSVYDTHESRMLLPVQLVRASRRLRIDGLAGGNNALNPIAAVHARPRVTDNILGTRRRSRRGNTRS